MQKTAGLQFPQGPARTSSILTKLVPTARLELAQLSPLPPQDSVSTNFTTSARRAMGNGETATGQRPFPITHSPSLYFGTSFAFGPAGASAGLGTSPAGAAAVSGCEVTPCITLPPVLGLCVAMYASPRLVR